MGCNWESRVCKLSLQIKNNRAPMSNNYFFQQRSSLACYKAKFSLFILTSFTFRGSWYETRIATCRSERCWVFDDRAKFTYSLYHIPNGGAKHILCCLLFLFMFLLCLVYSKLPVSLDCLFLIASSISLTFNYYLHQ
jgi:hypothetical protein